MDRRDDFEISCILLQQPFFLRQSEWIRVPRDFAKTIVQGKTYDAETGTGKDLYDALQMRLRSRTAEQFQVGDGSVMWREAVTRERLGQGSFRILVTDTYRRQCAITGEKALPALEAAHIKPVTEEGKHRVDNGLLFRSDIHRLFDKGYVTVTPNYKFRASRKLKDDFDNGEEYFRLQGNAIWVPKRSEYQRTANSSNGIQTKCFEARRSCSWHMLSDEVGPNRTLLVMCMAFRGKPDRYPNLTIKKIPKAVLSRCE